MPDAAGNWTAEDHAKSWARRQAAREQFKALGMPVRMQNALINEGCETLEDTLRFSDVEWMRVPNFGKISLRLLKHYQSNCWSLGDVDWW